MKCEKCNGEIIEGKLLSLQGIFFYPNDEEKKFNPKRNMIVCDCCKECGCLQNFRVTELEKIL